MPTTVEHNGQTTVDAPVATPDGGSSFNPANPAGLDELVGRWSDGVNTFAFAHDGTLTFTLDKSCEGHFVLSAQGLLDVSFGQCDASSVHLAAPIFRQAKVYRVGTSLYLDGDAGVFRLDRTGDGQS